MKKCLCIFISVYLILLTFSSCEKQLQNDEKENTLQYEEQDTSRSTTEKTPVTSDDENNESEKDVVESNLLPLSQKKMEFMFLSGAGGWRTSITLNVDGSFIGEYSDSEMGSNTEAYPNGSVYISTFSGDFVNIEKINDHSYRMKISKLVVEKTIGEEWIEDGIRYIASEPYGLEQGKDFILYLPDTPIDMVPEEFLTWWPYRYEQKDSPRETLDCYGILNVTTGYGFFNAV